jgi:hypothetical protein
MLKLGQRVFYRPVSSESDDATVDTRHVATVTKVLGKYAANVAVFSESGRHYYRQGIDVHWQPGRVQPGQAEVDAKGMLEELRQQHDESAKKEALRGTGTGANQASQALSHRLFKDGEVPVHDHRVPPHPDGKNNPPAGDARKELARVR